MKPKKYRSKKYHRGSIVGLILVIGVCLAIIGWGMLYMGLGARVNSAVSVSGITAREAADAGIADALYTMNEAFRNSTNFVFNPDPCSLPNSNAKFDYEISVPPYATPRGNYYDHYQIMSEGTSKGQKRRIYAITDITNLFDYGVIVSNKIELKEESFLDAYNSSLGVYGLDENLRLPGLIIGTTYAGHDNRIFLRNGVEVVGGIVVGVGGNPDEIIWDQATPGATTGNRYAMGSEYVWVDVNVPDCGSSLGNLDASVFTPDFTIGDPNDPNQLRVKYNNISIPNGGILYIVGNVDLCITGTLDLNQGALLVVEDEPWSSVRIYLYGDLNVGQSAEINNQTRIPDNFRLYGVGTSVPGEKWIINNSGFYYGVYYGPNAIVDVRQSAVFFGSIAGREFTLAQSGQVHYDLELSNLQEYDTGFKITRWWEEVVP